MLADATVPLDAEVALDAQDAQVHRQEQQLRKKKLQLATAHKLYISHRSPSWCHSLQAVDHPYLVVHSATAPGAAEAQKKLQEEEAQGLLQGICGVCHDPLEDPVVSVCQHAFCRACMMEYMDGAQGQAKCPSCDKPLSVDLNANPSVGDSTQSEKGWACSLSC